ncbi:MAG: 50S ribosomal protein L13 [Candidatus Neomarinimicrobiota bacterium]|nr:50S ribosomal protein L13 [Candidatus Neomarinimicrobiota bacterium]
MTITKSLKAKEINKVWYVADAEGKTLGRFASKIAKVLRGKHKPTFTPNLDMGDFVVVVNAEKVNLSGKKNTDKTYFKHTGYIGSKTFTKLDQIRKTHPERIVEKAVWGMLPKNRLGRSILKNLKVYSGPQHPHMAQQPKELIT